MSLFLGNTHFGVKEHHTRNLQVNISEKNYGEKGERIKQIGQVIWVIWVKGI